MGVQDSRRRLLGAQLRGQRLEGLRGLRFDALLNSIFYEDFIRIQMCV